MAIIKKGPNLFRIDAHVLRSGREIRRRELFTGTRAQAEERYLQLKKELREGANANSSLTAIQIRTFGDLIKIYKDKRAQCSSDHLNKIKLLERELGPVELSFFPDRFERYISRLRTTNSEKTKRPRSNACINRFVEIVLAAFSMGVALNLIESNPITKVRFPKLKEFSRDVVLTDADRLRLQNIIAQEAPHLSAIVRYALQVPCRRSELVNMTRADLDLINGAIRVKASIAKNDRGCWKPIPPDMLTYFQSLPNETEFLFYRKIEDRKKKTVRYAGLGDFKRKWRLCLEKAGLTGFHFHDTRHMAATALIDNGTPEQAVMTVANWKTNMLRNYYHREPKRALELMRFSPNLGHFLDTPKAKAI